MQKDDLIRFATEGDEKHLYDETDICLSNWRNSGVVKIRVQ